MSKDKILDQPKSRTTFIWMGLIGILAFVIYLGSLNADYVLDDFSAIAENRDVQLGFEGLPSIWKTDYRHGYWTEPGSLYRPLALTLFAIEWEFWPNDPVVAHKMNVLIYLILCMLIFYWLSNLMPSKRWLAFIVTVIFTLHPIHSEVVCNIKSADELLAMLFSVLTFLMVDAWLKRKKWIWIVFAITSMLLSILSKESAILMLFVMPFYMNLLKDETVRSSLLRSAIFLIPVTIYFILRIWVLGSLTGDEPIPFIDNIMAGTSLIERIPTSIYLACYYLLKLIYPFRLSHDYSYAEFELIGYANPLFYISLLVWLSIFSFGFLNFKFRPLLAFGIIFLILSLSISTNLIFIIGTHFGERLLFMPSLGFALIAGWMVWQWNQLNGVWRWYHLSAALLISVLIVFAWKTSQRAQEWQSETKLLEADVQTTPQSCRTHYRLGRIYLKEHVIDRQDQQMEHWIDKAIAELNESIRIYPEFADAHEELGLALQKKGRRAQAQAQYEEALRLEPNHFSAMINLSTLYFDQGQFQIALDWLLKASKVNPNSPLLAANMGGVLGSLGKFEESIDWYQRAIGFEPRNARYYYFVALGYSNLGKIDQSKNWLKKAHLLDPSIPEDF